MLYLAHQDARLERHPLGRADHVKPVSSRPCCADTATTLGTPGQPTVRCKFWQRLAVRDQCLVLKLYKRMMLGRSSSSTSVTNMTWAPEAARRCLASLARRTYLWMLAQGPELPIAFAGECKLCHISSTTPSFSYCSARASYLTKRLAGLKF